MKIVSMLITLDKEYDSDDAEHIANTLMMVRGVLEAKPIAEMNGMERYSLKLQAVQELKKKLWEILC